MSEFKVVGVVVNENLFGMAHIIKKPHVVSLCTGHCQHLRIIMGMMAGGSYLHNLLDVKAGPEN